MAWTTRSAMRALSPRLQYLHRTKASPFQQVRCLSSRYSNPAKRGFAAVPEQTPSFLGRDLEGGSGSSGPIRFSNPRKAEEERRQYHLGRMRFAGMGLLLSIAGLTLVIYNVDLDDLEQAEKKRKGKIQLDASGESNATFQGKEVHVVGAGDGKRIVAQGDGPDVDLVETGTSSVPHFPKTIFLPTTPDSRSRSGAEPNTTANPGNIDNQEEYTLVGLGIRTVMWIQVYVVGLYVRTKDINSLQSKLIHAVNPMASTLVPGEKADLEKKLLDPNASRQIWSSILEVPGIKTAWRVSPTRNTDFSHLRDGFVTGINKRTQEAKQLLRPGQPSEFDQEDFGQSIQSFKGIFSAGKAPKGSILIMTRDSDGGMDVLFEPKPDAKGRKEMEKLGSVGDERISRLIWLGYLAGEKVSSEAVRKGVMEGCVGFACRPVGSAETMVA